MKWLLLAYLATLALSITFGAWWLALALVVVPLAVSFVLSIAGLAAYLILTRRGPYQ